MNPSLALVAIACSFFAVLHQSSCSHLTNYDQTISSSTFGEPIFRLEPPNVINFANTQGATLLCLASGTPKPTISWYTSPAGFDISQQTILSGDQAADQSRQVTNVTNLRMVLQQGAAIRLFPFKESDFRSDIHSAEYRCVASNPIATIHSRSALVQAGKLLIILTFVSMLANSFNRDTLSKRSYTFYRSSDCGSDSSIDSLFNSLLLKASCSYEGNGS